MIKVDNSTILIVNDAADALELMNLQLHQAGYQILTAMGGREGFDVALRQRPDMVISDVAMPEVNGIELCRMIRAEDRLHTIPILLVSAIHKDDAKVVEGLKAGADDYLEVPYNQPRLVAKVARLLERKRAEGALKFQAHLLNTVEQAVIATDLEGKINYWNRFAEKLYGWSATEAIGGNIIDLVSAQTTLEQASEIMSHLREGRSWSGEFLVRRKDGTTFPAIVTDSPIYDDQGALVGIVGVSIDITERKRAEETLRESEEQYRTLFNSIDEGFCTIEVLFDGNDKPIDYRFLEVNPSFEKQTGIKDALGRRIREIAPRHEESWFEIYGHIALTGEPARFENLAAPLHRWYDAYAFRVGEPQEKKVAILFNNITARKRAEESLRRVNEELERRVEQRTHELTTANALLKKEIAERTLAEQTLRENHNLLQGVIEGTTDYIFVKDLKGCYLMVNSSAASFVGKPAEEIIGKDDTELFPPEIAQQLIKHDRQVIASDGMLTLEETLLYKGIPQTALVVENVYRNDQGKAIGLIGISRDITERKRAEEALRESEERFRLMVEGVTDYAIFSLDTEGRIASWNEGATRLKGYRADEIIGQHFSICCTPEDCAQGKPEQALKIATTENRYEDECWFVRKDGSRFWANIIITALRDEDGGLRGFVEITRDITERKRAEEALRESEEQNRAILRAIPDLMFLQTGDGVFLDCHAKAPRELLVAPEAFLGKNMRDVLPPDLVENLFRCFRRAKESDEPQVIEFTLPVQGEERYYEARIVRSSRDKILTIVRNITERKHAEEELRVSEESYRRLVELFPDAIIVVSEGKIDYVNQAGVKFFGATSPEQIVGLPALDFVHLHFHELVKGRMRQTLEGKKTELIEQKHVRLDGQVVNTEVTEIGITYRGKRGSQVIIRDITERVRAREARMQLQLRLLTAQEEERLRISRELHDQMGQHLPALMLGLKALKHASQNGSSVDDRLQQLQGLAERIARDTHALARDLRPAALDDFGLHFALSNYIEEWSERCGISVDLHSTGFDKDERLPPHIEITLYRIVQEVLNNVIKHAEAGHVSLILERSPEEVVAVIEDDGKGFDVEAVMGTPISERRLGLLGMQERVELVGGTLEIESAPGTGTTVAIRIPILTS